MRWWERQPGEREIPYRAFATFRDLGPGRTLREVAALLYGEGYREGAKRVPGRIKTWSSDNDWVARAAGYDEWLELVNRQAIEDHLRSRSSELERRREELRLANFENEERAAVQVRRLIEHVESSPLVTERTVREDEDGREVAVVIEPVLGSSFVLEAQRMHRIAMSGQPAKIAPTDPTGEHEYGQSAEDIDAEFEELLEGGLQDQEDESQ